MEHPGSCRKGTHMNPQTATAVNDSNSAPLHCPHRTASGRRCRLPAVAGLPGAKCAKVQCRWLSCSSPACPERSRRVAGHWSRVTALHKSRICDLRTLALIYPLFFLHLAHSFAQWALHNSFCFKRFRTLSIATGVWGVALVCLIKKILACSLWNLFGRPNLTFRVSPHPLPSAQNSSSSLGFSGVTL